MKRILLVAFLAFTSVFSFTQTVTVTGNTKSIFGDSSAALKSRVCFSLILSDGQRPADPHVAGVGMLTNTQNVCVSPAADGSFSTAMYPNDVIITAGAPNTTLWNVSWLYNGVYGGGGVYSFLAADLTENLNSKSPATLSPSVTVTPTDNVYMRLDAGNSPTSAAWGFKGLGILAGFDFQFGGGPGIYMDHTLFALGFKSTGFLGWAPSGFANAAFDTGESRCGVATVCFGNGTQGDATGIVKLNTVLIPRGSDGTLAATITNDTGGGINLTTNSGLTWEVANGGNLASPPGFQLQLNGATSGAVGLAVPAIAGSNVWTIPAATDTAVGKATTDTFINKTPGSPWNGVACGNVGADFCLPVIVGTPVHLTGITANVAAINVLAAPLTGLYIWSCNCRTTTAGSGTTGTFTLAFANEAGAQTFTSGTFALNSTTFATGTVSFNLPIHINSGTAATFAVNGTWGTSVAACDSFLLREN